ncbi:hypothetical protein PGT21_002766 [Puccinia graminis f. sp. tritici]|uniref:Uncharacterized protein n=1 Tax=Puccinia graminis f. sp. tritici TaxID=56615 RepID=A0A5B0MK03_PUCGR|nr:hypothetical protein PGT21_002766 [Puccinia graminis f. sp. tritici]
MPQSHSQNQLLIYVLHSPLETPTRSISCRQFCRELSNLLLSRPSNGHLSLTQSNPEPTLLNPHSPLPISLFPIRHCRFPTELSPIVPLNCIRGFRLCWMGDNRGQFCLSTVIVRSLGRKRTPRAHCGFGGSGQLLGIYLWALDIRAFPSHPPLLTSPLTSHISSSFSPGTPTH